MTWRSWWLVSLLLLGGTVGGCGDGDHDGDHDEHPAGPGCVLIREVEPNETTLTADFLGDTFVGDCADVVGSLVDPVDVDRYRFLAQESLSLLVTLDHSPQVNFDVQLVDGETGQLLLVCGNTLVPEVCVLPLSVSAHARAVEVVVTAVSGAGPYTLTLDAL